MRILLVEDARDAAAYLVTRLSANGHRMTFAEEGREGLEQASRGTKGSFDAMIIDRVLPGIGGLSTVAALRAAVSQTLVLGVQSA